METSAVSAWTMRATCGTNLDDNNMSRKQGSGCHTPYYTNLIFRQ